MPSSERGGESALTYAARMRSIYRMSETNPKTAKRCKRCRKPFEPKRYWQRFCGRECQLAQWEKEHPRLNVKPKERP